MTRQAGGDFPAGQGGNNPSCLHTAHHKLGLLFLAHLLLEIGAGQ